MTKMMAPTTSSTVTICSSSVLFSRPSLKKNKYWIDFDNLRDVITTELYGVGFCGLALIWSVFNEKISFGWGYSPEELARLLIVIVGPWSCWLIDESVLVNGRDLPVPPCWWWLLLLLLTWWRCPDAVSIPAAHSTRIITKRQPILPTCPASASMATTSFLSSFFFNALIDGVTV